MGFIGSAVDTLNCPMAYLPVCAFRNHCFVDRFIEIKCYAFFKHSISTRHIPVVPVLYNRYISFGLNPLLSSKSEIISSFSSKPFWGPGIRMTYAELSVPQRIDSSMLNSYTRAAENPAPKAS